MGYYVDNQIEYYYELATQKAIISIGDLNKNESFSYSKDNKTSYTIDSTKIRIKYIELFKQMWRYEASNRRV